MLDTLHITAITGCACCGGNHEHLDARRMAQPFAPAEAGGLTWTHWAPCPMNGDPILIMVTADVDDRELPEILLSAHEALATAMSTLDDEVRRG